MTLSAQDTTHDTSVQADALIGRFGGIRPMAAKTGIAVTTVQGWKKRGAVPANRMTQIRDAARIHGIDLNDLPLAAQTAANDDADSAPAILNAEPSSPAPSTTPPMAALSPAPELSAPLEKPARGRGADISWVALMMLAAAIIVGLLVLTPGIKRLKLQDQRLNQMAQELAQTHAQINDLREQNALLSGAIPDAVKTQMQELSDRARGIEETVNELGTQARALTEGVMGTNEGTIEQRLSKVEEKMTAVSDLQTTERLSLFLERLTYLAATPEGRNTISRATQQIYADLSASPDLSISAPYWTNGVSLKHPDVAPVLQGLSPNDTRTAVLLLTLIQLRTDIASASHDATLQNLSVMERFFGKDDPARAILAQLFDVSKDNAVSGKDLSASFTKLLPEARRAALNDPGAPLKDRVLARLHTVFRIERGGVPLTGTKNQHTLDQAQEKMQAGDLPGTMAALQALSGESAKILSPWAERAENVMTTQSLLNDLTRRISAEISLTEAPLLSPTNKGATLKTDDMMRGLMNSLSVTSP